MVNGSDGGGYYFYLLDPLRKIRILYRAWKISDLTSSGGYFSKIFMKIFGSLDYFLVDTEPAKLSYYF
jgi:hypothetical protein